MALDATARYANVKDSIKKYFIDNLYTVENVPLQFDVTLGDPDTLDKGVNKWVSIKFGPMVRGTVCDLDLELWCCTRSDNEGFRLAQLTDTVMGYITDTTTTDGFKRIPFYRSKAVGAWELLGAMVITEQAETASEETEFGIKFRLITCTLKWAAKV